MQIFYFDKSIGWIKWWCRTNILGNFHNIQISFITSTSVTIPENNFFNDNKLLGFLVIVFENIFSNVVYIHCIYVVWNVFMQTRAVHKTANGWPLWVYFFKQKIWKNFTKQFNQSQYWHNSGYNWPLNSRAENSKLITKKTWKRYHTTRIFQYYVKR